MLQKGTVLLECFKYLVKSIQKHFILRFGLQLHTENGGKVEVAM